MIFETIVITHNAQQQPHISPFGVRYEGEHIVIAPYKPSVTYDNILANQYAVMNLTDDVRVFAGALTGHTQWPVVPIALPLMTTVSDGLAGYRLADCLAHKLLKLIEVREDIERPQLVMKVIESENHQAFQGFNRAQAAVVELSILVSRLHWLPREKIDNERQYLQIAIDKTAGEREKIAWHWLTAKIDAYNQNIKE